MSHSYLHPTVSADAGGHVLLWDATAVKPVLLLSVGQKVCYLPLTLIHRSLSPQIGIRCVLHVRFPLSSRQQFWCSLYDNSIAVLSLTDRQVSSYVVHAPCRYNQLLSDLGKYSLSEIILNDKGSWDMAGVTGPQDGIGIQFPNSDVTSCYGMSMSLLDRDLSTVWQCVRCGLPLWITYLILEYPHG
jgi:hypothetical protein